MFGKVNVKTVSALGMCSDQNLCLQRSELLGFDKKDVHLF